jgi:hypothetical protein
MLFLTSASRQEGNGMACASDRLAMAVYKKFLQPVLVDAKLEFLYKP